MKTSFLWDERCFWHGGGDFAFTLPLGGLVQPMASGGLPENPETKMRRDLRRRQCYLPLSYTNINQNPTFSHVKLRLPTKPLFQWGKRIFLYSNSIRI